MRGFLRVALTLGLMAAATEGVAQAAPERSGPLRHRYDMYAGGLWVGEMTMDAVMREDGSYVAGANLQTAGLVQAIFDAGFVAEVTGRTVGGELRTERFKADATDQGDTQTVEIAYADGRPQTIRAAPPLRKKPYALKLEEVGPVADPLTGSLSAFAPRRSGMCGRRIPMFDGSRRFDLVLGPPQPDGDLLKCVSRYERIAGFKAKLLAPDRRSIPFTIWYEKDADGYWTPLKSEVPNKWVTLTVTRRD